MLSKINYYCIELGDDVFFISTRRGKVFTYPRKIDFIRGWNLIRLTKWVTSKGGVISPVVKK